VEDYFHIYDTNGMPPFSEWDNFPSGVEAHLNKLFELLAKHDVKATCFFLGYIAQKYPHLVKSALKNGHEVASHGMYHKLTNQMTEQEFLQDIIFSKHLLEDISGEQVYGYRSPCFSATGENPWLFENLVKAGYKYDSSVFPASRVGGGIKTNQTFPHWIPTSNGNLYEFPISVRKVLGKNICFFGGGYLRLFPKPVIMKMADSIYKEGNPVLYYIHPREIDPQHPRIPLGYKQRFKSYVNLKTVKPKLESIFGKGSFQTCNEYLSKLIYSELK
jgi:polysaccharide deacetylase family protein (PEP-CTERM system associated)